MAMYKWWITIFSVAAIFTGLACDAFSSAGVSPNTFFDHEELTLKVHSLISINTQIPTDYYSLPFCQPKGGPQMIPQYYGEFLTGNMLQSSPYSIKMKDEKYCQILCQMQLSKMEAETLTAQIGQGYRNNWIVDNIPSVLVNTTTLGFPIGFVDDSSDTNDAYVFNHVNIILQIHKIENEFSGHRIVGFQIEPISVQHRFTGDFEWDGASLEAYIKGLQTCPGDGTHLKRSSGMANQIVREGEKIVYTYDVIFVHSSLEWSSHWNIYFNEYNNGPPKVHWFSIINFILSVSFLSGCIFAIIVRSLRRDISSYIAMATLPDNVKDKRIGLVSWICLCADVFRPPQNFPMFYCVCVGSGVQLAITVAFVFVLSAIGYLNPNRRVYLLQLMLVSYVLCGSLAGYSSSRLYKAFHGRSWQVCSIFTAIFLPVVCCGMLFFNNISLCLESSGSLLFWSIFKVFLVFIIWCCISAPFVFIGSYFGFKEKTLTFPTVTSTVARSIPPPIIFLDPKISVAVAGFITFASAYLALFFILTPLWTNHSFYVFGFTFIIYIILIIIVAEITVLLVYYQLCSENHRWWWFSFLTGASISAYMVIYSVFWFNALDTNKLWITYRLYFGLTMLSSGILCLITGAVGSITSFWFVRKIFGTIKI